MFVFLGHKEYILFIYSLVLFSPSLSSAGRVVRSFGVSVVNSTCVSLSWSLLDDVSAVPLFMVVQWSPVPGHHEGRTGATWTRLPYTDSPVHLRGDTISLVSSLRVSVHRVYSCRCLISGDFFGSEQSGFSLYPVFADGEAEPMYATGTHWFFLL